MEIPMRGSGAVMAILAITAAFSGCSKAATDVKAAFSATPQDPLKATYVFDASESKGDGLVYDWDFGDLSAHGSKRLETHTYQYLNGNYSVVLRTRDASGRSDSTRLEVPVGTKYNTPPFLYLRVDQRRVEPNTTVTFDASRSFDADGDPIAFQWDFNSAFEQSDYRRWENLGQQFYGYYARGPPPNASNPPASQEGSEAPVVPVADRSLSELAKHLLGDGDHVVSEPTEPRNPTFNGSVASSGAVQQFRFPSPATYFVLVRVFDVKQEGAIGFIRIRVEEKPPEVTQTVEDLDRDLAMPTSDAACTPNTAPACSFRVFEFGQPFMGNQTVSLSFAKKPEAPGDTSVQLRLCKTSVSATTSCPIRLGAGGSGRSFQYDVTHLDAGNIRYKAIVQNLGMPIQYDLSILQRLDTNPWIATENAPPHTD